MPSASPRGDVSVLTIPLDEVLDGEAVRRVRRALEGAPPRAPIVVDFGPVRHVEWYALAWLARELAEKSDGRVAARGLCDHHLRVLRYLDGCATWPVSGGAAPAPVDAALLARASMGPPPADARVGPP